MFRQIGALNLWNIALEKIILAFIKFCPVVPEVNMFEKYGNDDVRRQAMALAHLA